MSDKDTVAEMRAHIERLRAALKPFATAKIGKEGRGRLAGWPDHADCEGVELIWDPDFENGATLTIGQFKRAKTAWEEQ